MRVKVSQISKIGRNTQGVIIKKNDKGEIIASIAAVPHVDEAAEEAVEENAEGAENPQE